MRFAVLTLCLWSAAGQTLYRTEPFAGSGYAGDGRSATLAPLLQPQGLAVDRDGSIVVADAADHRIRRITPNGLIYTIAGDGVAGFSGDGLPAGVSRVQTPYGIAIGPNRELYIADLGNGRVRVVSPDGIIRTFAGGGEQLPSADPVKPTNAKLSQPRNVAVDANGTVYISDFGANRVYRVGGDGLLVTVAGTGESGESEDGPANKGKFKGPAGLVIDPTGSLYVADSGNHRVRKIANGWMESITDTSKNKLDFGAVTSIALDRNGRLHTAGGNRIPVVTPAGAVSLIDTAADEVFIDASGRLLTVAYRQVRSHVANSIKILAGNGIGAFSGDGGPPDEWRFQKPTGLARDESGSLYIADAANGRIRRITSDGVLSTITAGLGQPGYFAFDRSNLLYFSDSKAGTVYLIDRAGRLQVFSRGNGAKPFRAPSGLAFDARGDLYVADTGNSLIRKVTPDGFVSTIAGGGSSDMDGFGLAMELKSPVGIAIAPDGFVWFSETNRIRKLSPDGKVSTLAGLPVVDPKGLRFDSKGRLVIADAGSQRVIGVLPDGTLAFQEKFEAPADVWPELDGSILVSDTSNHQIWRTNPRTEVPPPVVTPPAEPKLASLRIIHPGSAKAGLVAPGQLIFIECDQATPPGALEVRFGTEVAKVLAVERATITAVVPPRTELGSTEVSVSDAKGKWAVGPAEVAILAPAVVGGVQNENGSFNGIDTPALRGSIVTLYLTGEGNSPDPGVSAEVAGIPAAVLSAERSQDRPGLFKLTIQVPGGYLPSGSLSLRIWIDGAKIAEDLTLVCQ